MEKTLKDPAGGDFVWTQADIDGVMGELGRRMAQGKFDPKTWEGEEFEFTFADGTVHCVLPKYFAYVYKQWKEM